MVPLHPGEIYFAAFGSGKSRPVIILSRESLNRGSKVVVVPLTSQHFEKRRTLPYCVPFFAGEFGLTVQCVAKVDELGAILYSDIEHLRGKIGALSPERMGSIKQAVRYVIEDV